MSGMCKECGEFFGSQNGYCSVCWKKREGGGDGGDEEEEEVEIPAESSPILGGDNNNQDGDHARRMIEEARKRKDEEERQKAREAEEAQRPDDLTRNQKILILFGASETIKFALFFLFLLFGWNWGTLICILIGIIYCLCCACCNICCIPCCACIGTLCCCCECCDLLYVCTIPTALCGIFCFIAGPFLTLCAPVILLIPNPALFAWFIPDFDEFKFDA